MTLDIALLLGASMLAFWVLHVRNLSVRRARARFALEQLWRPLSND